MLRQNAIDKTFCWSFRKLLTGEKFELIAKWKTSNGGSITNFNDISKIEGISEQTVESIRKFCESQLEIDDKRVPPIVNESANESMIPEPMLSHNDENVVFEVQPTSFNNSGQFVLYDERDGVIDLPLKKLSISHSDSEYKNKKAKVPKLIIEPKLRKIYAIRSFTSIYHDVNRISCTRFSTNSGKWDVDTKIDVWNFYKLPIFDRKNLCETCDGLLKIVDQLPSSDIYIIDDYIKAQYYRKSVGPKQLVDIVHMNHQCAVLVTVLQQRMAKYNDNNDDKSENVHFMSYSSVGPLYNLMVEREIISTHDIIRNMLHEDRCSKNVDPLNIDISNDITAKYIESNRTEREHLGRSLLLGMTFIRLALL